MPNPSHATNADQAANALRLEGSPGSSYRDHCPSETEPAPVDLCVSTTPLLNVQYEDALRICAEKGLRIPTPSEAYTLDLTATLTDVYWTEGPKSYALLMNERIFEKVETPNDLNGARGAVYDGERYDGGLPRREPVSASRAGDADGAS